MQTSTLTFYGGVDEIGGNKILLKDVGTKILLDFGMSFGARNCFYSSPFLTPKSPNSLQELGILPSLKGVYRFDQDIADVDAVFLSHSHLDHSAYLSFIKREIPVYCGETTSLILEALSEMRRTGIECDFGGLTFESFRTNDKIQIGSITVEPMHVDHSVPGAYGFVLHTSQGSVVYTGDFRAHGAKPEMTEEFLRKAGEADPLAIVTEATNITGASVSSEAEVEDKLDRIVRNTKGIVLAEFAYADVDRLNSFYHVAKKYNRCLAISLKQAFLLSKLCTDRKLKIPRIKDDNVLIFRKSKKRHEKWEEQLLEKYEDKVVDGFEVSKRQGDVILVLPFYDLEELVDLKPNAGSCFVLSSSEPFNEEMAIDHEKLSNWLRHYGLPQYHVHVSGHIMPLELKEALGEINPRKVFPIHTEGADLFCRFVADLKPKIIRVENGKNYKL